MSKESSANTSFGAGANKGFGGGGPKFSLLRSKSGLSTGDVDAGGGGSQFGATMNMMTVSPRFETRGLSKKTVFPAPVPVSAQRVLPS